MSTSGLNKRPRPLQQDVRIQRGILPVQRMSHLWERAILKPLPGRLDQLARTSHLNVGHRALQHAGLVDCAEMVGEQHWNSYPLSMR